MKKILNNLLLPALVVMFTTSGCEKNDQDATFKDVNRINLEGLPEENPAGDSVSFTFAIYPSSFTSRELTVVAKLSGQVSDTDREFKLALDPEKTTADPSEYSIPSTFVIKAGEVESRVPITVKRSERISSRSVQLTFNIIENQHFAVGHKKTFKLIWTDELIQPRTWYGSFDFYLGKYSKVKHKLIIDNTTYTDLNLIDVMQDFDLFADVIHIAMKAKEALDAYNLIHPNDPLKNEFDEEIGICMDCN